MERQNLFAALSWFVAVVTNCGLLCALICSAEIVDDSSPRIEPLPRSLPTTVNQPTKPLSSHDILTAIDWTATPYPADHLGGAALDSVRPPYSYLGDDVGLFDEQWTMTLGEPFDIFRSEIVEMEAEEEFNTSNLLDSNDELFDLINDLQFDKKNEDATSRMTSIPSSQPEDAAPEEESLAARLVFPNRSSNQAVNSPEDEVDLFGRTDATRDSPLYDFRRYLSADTPPEEWKNANWFIMAVVAACGILVMLLLPTDPKVVATRGQVLYNDKPLTSGLVMFQPEVGPASQANIQPDGTFVLQTPGRGRGTSVGKNRVKVLCFVGQDANSADVDPEQLALGRSFIPKKFADYDTSGLTVTIHPRGNRPFIIQLSD